MLTGTWLLFRQFLKDGVIYGVSTFLTRGVSFLLLPFYTRVLSPTDYGVIDMLTVFTSLVGFTVALEISQGLARHFSDARDQADRVEYASTALWFTTVAYTLFVVLGFVFAAPATRLLLESGELVPVFIIALFAIWANGVFGVLQMQLRFQLQARDFAVTSVLSSVAAIGSTIAFVLVWDLGVVGVILGQFVGRVIGAAAAYYYARSSYRLTFSYEKLRQMLRFSLPLVPSSLGVMLTVYIDRIAIKQLMTLGDVGVFGIAYRLVSILGLLIIGFQTALVPLIYANYRLSTTPGQIARIFRYFIAAELVVLLGISIYAEELIRLVAPPAYYAAAAVVPLLAAATLLSQAYMFAPGLSIANRTASIAVISVIGAALNTILNFALIPGLGISGSALANLISAGLVFALYAGYGQKHYRIPFPWTKLAIGCTITVVAIGVSQFIRLPLSQGVLVKGALLATATGMFLLTGLIEAAEVRRAGAMLSARFKAVFA